MKPLISLLLVLASCAHQPNEVHDASLSIEEPKPAIRERIVPGSTHGNVALQEETIGALKKAVAAGAEHADCPFDETNVSDTWAPKEPSPAEFSSAFLRWKELWTVDACGRSLDFEVVYMRHETGVINVSVSQQEEGPVWLLN